VGEKEVLLALAITYNEELDTHSDGLEQLCAEENMKCRAMYGKAQGQWGTAMQPRDDAGIEGAEMTPRMKSAAVEQESIASGLQGPPTREHKLNTLPRAGSYFRTELREEPLGDTEPSTFPIIEKPGSETRKTYLKWCQWWALAK
jgi:hypothetical protein